MAEKLHKEDKEWSRLAALSLLRLSSTGYKDVDIKKIEQLTKLRLHFEALDDESDEVGYLKPKYWYSKPNWFEILLWSIIIAVIVYFCVIFAGTFN